LQESYNIERLTDLENQIKIKERNFTELKEEEASLKKIEVEQ
jgi:hypothetical protein